MNYEIKISGSGGLSHIIHSLRDLIRSLEEAKRTEASLDGKTWEDPVLITEITEQ